MKHAHLFGNFDDPQRFDQISSSDPSCERGYLSTFANDLRIQTDSIKNSMVDDDMITIIDDVSLLQKSAERMGFLQLAEMAHSVMFVSDDVRLRQQVLELIGSCEVLLMSIDRGLHGVDEVSSSKSG